MLLELAGDGAVHRPVAAVVRAHGELVDEVAGAPPSGRTSNSSTASTPVTPSSPAMPESRWRWPRRPGRGRRPAPGRAPRYRCRRSARSRRPARRPPGPRAPRDEDRELPAERDPLLEQYAVGQRSGPAHLGEPVGQVRGGVHDADALAVVAAAGCLRHDRPPDRRREGRRRPPLTVRAPSAGTGLRSRRAARAWRACPGRTPGLPGGVHGPPSASSAASTSAGTCSWSKVTTSQPAGERAYRLEVGMRPTGADGTTSAADASGASARTLSWTPSSTAGPCIIRASWPPPITPTTGNPPGVRRGASGGSGRALTAGEPIRARLRHVRQASAGRS